MQERDLTGKDVKIAEMMSRAAATAQEQYLKAFIAETGLKPSQAKLIYGVSNVMGSAQFRCYFVRREEQEELVYLRGIKGLLVEGDITKATQLAGEVSTLFSDGS